MMIGRKTLNDHEKFKELCALANSGTLTADERSELDGHLQICQGCRELYNQYLLLVVEGVPRLASRYDHQPVRGSWDCMATRRSLFARVRAGERRSSSEPQIDESVGEQLPIAPISARWMSANWLAWAALAACLVVTVGLCTYQLGRKTRAGITQAQASAEDHLQKLAAEKRSVEKLLVAQTNKFSLLSQESAQKERELAKLRLMLRGLEDRANELVIARDATDEQLRGVSQERGALNGKLHDVEQAYQKVQAELASLSNERDNALRRTISLEARVEELSAVNREQERKLRDDEDYLAYDRDIRELMGARKLYIADVFDVDSGSRTRKPFGRVFYTQGKSLLFYAFDLDHQTSLKSASTFQVWGQKGTARGEQAQPMSLGILYKDSESNRRWVLRCDDPKQMAEIEAVFVTIEPHGGSPKPTGKPFLYALLRKETNHP
jgi:hypothetical protein